MANRTSKLVVAVAALLLTVLASYPYELANVVDTSCIATAGFTICQGDSTHGCASTKFSVETSGTYYLTASIDGCSGGNCTQCVSEAWIYEGTRFLYCVHSGCCGEFSIGVNLQGGHTYTLYCCLLPCGNANCSANCGNCPARASVH